MTTLPLSSGHPVGTSAAQHLSPSFPERAAWGTVSKLRAWQTEALDAYFLHEPRDFLAAATPGAGKTTFALRLAAELLARKTIDRVTVVAPTEHLKKQWADAADRVGIRLDPTFKNAHGRHGRHYHGVAVTYAQVAVRAELHRDLTLSGRTLVILDEVHHGGDALSWGDAIREAFEPATRRLSLTGTPFRSDTAPIPFVSYLPDEHGIRVSQTDYNYGYGRALLDGVVRPVLFMVYAGHMRWRSSVGEEMEARLGEGNTKDITSQAWRTALDPKGDWIPSVLRAADRRLTEVRQSIPDAGGLVIATDHYAARAYAELLEGLSGQPVTIVLSDEKEASDRIDEFSNSSRRWMVAVRMVSEGVDIPRLAVGVYATSAATPLYFAQAIGRFVRARRRGELASIFLPNVPSLMALAGAMELERDHALDRRETGDPAIDLFRVEEDMMDAANRQEKASEALQQEFSFEAISSHATFDRVMYENTEFGAEAIVGSDEELDFIGIPGLLEPDQVRELLQHRQHRQARRKTEPGYVAPVVENPDAAPAAPLYRTLKEQRSLLNSVVGIWSKTSGEPHGLIHAELRRVCGGPAVAQASVTQLQSRIALVRKWMGSNH
ncbi:DEAD/DEAH box helicase [Subtercola frigoramans]|uniref:Superfamily II DNA or RNA helicase n=1 Tax=Subtercola frigoramans TaxID=120298 RepID=A0ABS2L5B0_9MICO|nr:DEAD/DEAH box helicase [Subtercola frigoramans]MBM7472283.1 superfamily II DNA or RNA helicase [Subtercola frigoramans]